MPITSEVRLFTLGGNGCGYDQCGIAELRLYHPTQNLQAGATARIPLKPALVMSRCCVLPLFCFRYSVIKYTNLYNRSATLTRYGWAGRLFCKPLDVALARVGLRICLTAKGWVHERTLIVFFIVH